MALTFCDGFDSYAATADLLKKWAMATAPWAWSAAADQNGATGGIVTAVATTGGAILSAPANTFGGASRVGVGFWLKISATPAARANLIWFLPTGSTVSLCRISVETSGFLSLQNHADTTLLTGSTNVCTNAWVWVEIAPQDGITVLQRCVVGTTSQWNTTANIPLADTFNCLQFFAIANRTVSISDVMCYDDSGTFTVSADFPLTARKITTVRPNGDDVVQLTRSTGSTNYTLVDDVAGDVSDYVEGVPTVQDTYDYAALGFTPTLVNAVMVNSFVTMSGAGTRNFQALAKSGATTTAGASTPALATPLVKQQPYYVDPNTAAAWTQAGIDAAKFGIKI